jgi:hypothetical protein
MAIGARSLVNDRHQPDNQRMSRRFQFSLKWLFVAMLAVACFFGGVRFERERRRREGVAAARADVTPINAFVYIAVIDPKKAYRVMSVLEGSGIASIIEGSVVYGVSVPPSQESRAAALLRADAAAQGYWVQTK